MDTLNQPDGTDHETADAGETIRLLEVSDPLRRPVIRAAIQALHLPPGSRGLDVGCGIGLQALQLAEAVGPSGHVTGLDLSPQLLQHANGLAARAGLAGRVTFREGDMHALPFDDRTFDWLWSADCAGYGAAEPLPLMQELARVVRPGGTVAILFWSSQMLLPGHPMLEARLNATRAGIAPFVPEMAPELHPLATLRWLREAGLEDTWVKTLAGTAHAPLDEDIRNALVALLEMRWKGAEAELSPQDRAAYRRLSQAESPDFILNQPDYYAFFTYSLFCGQVAG
jgi:demethylmenaquinone methyltransferase/2-methoxy-6-polyprenyl-1,4-benzoquinol methylase